LLIGGEIRMQKIRKEKQLKNCKHHKQFDQDDLPERLPHRHRPKAIQIKPDNRSLPLKKYIVFDIPGHTPKHLNHMSISISTIKSPSLSQRDERRENILNNKRNDSFVNNNYYLHVVWRKIRIFTITTRYIFITSCSMRTKVTG
jgi:hypothetical protein